MRIRCEECEGTGEIVVSWMKCEVCSGTGKVKMRKGGIDELIDVRTCEKCGGKGKIERKEICPSCDGHGEKTVCDLCKNEITEFDDLEVCKECDKKIVRILDETCDYEDVFQNKVYKGKVTKVEKIGFFVSLNSNVVGLIKRKEAKRELKVGEEVVVKVKSVRPKEMEIDFALSDAKGKLEKKVKKEIESVDILSLRDLIGRKVKILGEVIQIQVTGGPTVFTIGDGSSLTWAVAFGSPGMRAYPHVSTGDLVEVIGRVTSHFDKIQLEIMRMEKLWGKEAIDLKSEINKKIEERSKPSKIQFLVEDETLVKLRRKLEEAAREIKRAVFSGRPIVVRHHWDADGTSSAIVLEQALLPLIEKNIPDPEAKWHYYKRIPSKAPFYELEDVLRDLSISIEDRDRFGQKFPLIVLLDNGSGEEDLPALRRLKAYGIEAIVVDHHFPSEKVEEYALHINPYLVGGDQNLTTGVLATELARMISPSITDKVKHVPAVSLVADRSEHPLLEEYLKLAESKGLSREDLEVIAEAIDHEAYHLRFLPGRGIIEDILGLGNLERQRKLLDIIWDEVRRKKEERLRSVLKSVKSIEMNGVLLNTLDVEKYSQRFQYPPPGKTCGIVHDELGKNREKVVTIAHGPDFAVIRIKGLKVNLNEIINSLKREMPYAEIDGGGHEAAGSIKFVEGYRKEVLEGLALKITSNSH